MSNIPAWTEMDVRTRLACQFALGNCLCMRRNHGAAGARPRVPSSRPPSNPRSLRKGGVPGCRRCRTPGAANCPPRHRPARATSATRADHARKFKDALIYEPNNRALSPARLYSPSRRREARSNANPWAALGSAALFRFVRWRVEAPRGMIATYGASASRSTG
jgi:hypothetical protein